MSGFSSVMRLEATHRKPLTQLLPWLPVVPPPITQPVFYLCFKVSMKPFVSYPPTGSVRSVPVPSPSKAAIYFLIHSGTLGIKPSCLSKGTSVVQKTMIVQFIICWDVYCSPLHKFLSGIMWEMKLFVNTRPSLKTFLNWRQKLQIGQLQLSSNG